MPQLTRRARTDLDGLAPALSNSARGLIRRLDDEPHLPKRLMGSLHGKHSARLGPSHRIIYTESEGGIVVLTISARKDAYR